MTDVENKATGIGGPKAKKVRIPSNQKPHDLAQDVEALKQKYGSQALYQIIGRSADGTDGPAQDGLGQNQPITTHTYPVKLYAPDKYDTNVALKNAAPASFGKKMLSADDLEWMRRKQDQMTAAEFKQFVASMYNKDDPAQLALLHKVYPELLSEQEEIIDQRFDLIKQLTKIRLHGGPQDVDDLRLLFALNSGAVLLPKGDMWDPKTWSGIAANKSQAMSRGLFSVVRVQQAGTGDAGQMPFNALGYALGGSLGSPMTSKGAIATMQNQFPAMS